MKFSIKDFFSKCDQICSFLRIWSHLLKKSLTENFISCAVNICMNIVLELTMFFELSHVSITFVDKTDPSDPLKREEYWRRILWTMAPYGLNIEDSV